MIQNIVHGHSFKGALSYIFQKEGASFVAGNTARNADDLNKLTSEFLSVANQRKAVKKSVVHISFAPNPDDNITDETACDFVQRYLEKMGYENSLFVMGKHTDTGHDHYHVVTSAVDLNGIKISDSKERIKNMKVSRALEKEFDLVVTEYDHDKPKTASKHQNAQPVSQLEFIQAAVERVAASQPSFPDFVKGLQDVGIEVKATFANDKIRLSYSYENYAVKASDIGGSQKLLEKKYGVIYDATTERKAIEKLCTRATKAEHRAHVEQKPERSEIGRDRGLESKDQSASEANRNTTTSTGQSLDELADQRRNGQALFAFRERISSFTRRVKKDSGELVVGFQKAVSTLQATSKRLTAIRNCRGTIREAGGKVEQLRERVAAILERRESSEPTMRELFERMSPKAQQMHERIAAQSHMPLDDYLAAKEPQIRKAFEKQQTQNRELNNENNPQSPSL